VLLKLYGKNVNWFNLYIYFYLFVTPWHFSKSQLSVLTTILLIWSIVKYKDIYLEKLKKVGSFLPMIFLLIFIVYSYVSTLWSEPISQGLEHVNTFYKYYFLIIPAILISMNKEESVIGIKVLVLSFGCYALYSILIYLGFFNSIEYGFQPENPTGHLRYLIATQYMLMAFFLGSFFVYFSHIKKEKILFLIIAILSFFALFINNSRTSQLAFFIILLILTVLILKKYIFNFKAIILFLIISFSSIYFLYKNDKFDRFVIAYNETKKVLENNTYSGSVGLRIYFNKVGFEIFKDNLFFGTGPKDNRILLQEKQKLDTNYNARIINHFHSEHMDTLTAYGLIGYSLLFLSIVILIYNLRKIPLYYYMSLTIFLSLFFNSFANKTLSVKPLNYVYIIFFLLFVIIAFNEKNKKESKLS